MRTLSIHLAVSVALLSTAALAQDSLAEVGPGPAGNGHYSVLTGRTVGANNFIVHPEIGYPGLSVGLIWGQSNSFDAGVRFSAGYGTRLGIGFAPGVGAQAILRWNLVNRGIISFGPRFEPGVFISAYDRPGDPYVNRGSALLVAPVGFDLGIHPHPIVNIALGLDVGLGVLISYGGGAAFVLPVQAGPGLELNLTDRVQLTLDTRFGTWYSAPLPDYRGYGFKAAIGLAFRT